MPPRDRLTRRQALTRGGLALLGMASGATGVRLAAAGDASRKSPVGPEPGHGGPAAEPVAGPPITTPPATGARLVTLTAAEADLDVGGRVVRTWAYGQAAPGPLLRGNRGEVLEVRLRNRLPDPTTIHWHGMAVPWDQDGVPDLPAAAIAPGHDGAYRFTLRDPGTYWYHPHVGVQLDRGLYGVVIVDDPREAGGYDVELVVVLDDWLDGTGRTPDEVLRALGGGMRGMSAGTGMGAGAGDTAGAAAAARPHPPGQRGRRHGLPGRARRAPADGDPQRRLPGEPGHRGHRAAGDGGALRPRGHPRGRCVPARRRRRGQGRAGDGGRAHRRRRHPARPCPPWRAAPPAAAHERPARGRDRGPARPAPRPRPRRGAGGRHDAVALDHQRPRRR